MIGAICHWEYLLWNYNLPEHASTSSPYPFPTAAVRCDIISYHLLLNLKYENVSIIRTPYASVLYGYNFINYQEKIIVLFFIIIRSKTIIFLPLNSCVLCVRTLIT